MKKNKIIIVLLIIIACNLKLTESFATSEIIEEQENLLGISEFIEESENVSKNFFEGVDLNDIFESLITGKIKTDEIFSSIKTNLKNEFMSMITIMLTIIIVVIIHGIFKVITENLNNESVGKIAYFIQYILIVIFTMKVYSEAIEYIKNSIDMLTDYTYMFIPILMTLAISTGSVTTVRNNRADDIICNYFYRANNIIYNYSFFANRNCFFNNFEHI